MSHISRLRSSEQTRIKGILRKGLSQTNTDLTLEGMVYKQHRTQNWLGKGAKGHLRYVVLDFVS